MAISQLFNDCALFLILNWFIPCQRSVTFLFSQELAPQCQEEKSICGYMQINSVGLNRVSVCACKGRVECPFSLWNRIQTIRHGNDFYKVSHARRTQLCAAVHQQLAERVAPFPLTYNIPIIHIFSIRCYFVQCSTAPVNQGWFLANQTKLRTAALENLIFSLVGRLPTNSGLTVYAHRTIFWKWTIPCFKCPKTL